MVTAARNRTIKTKTNPSKSQRPALAATGGAGKRAVSAKPKSSAVSRKQPALKVVPKATKSSKSSAKSVSGRRPEVKRKAAKKTAPVLAAVPKPRRAPAGAARTAPPVAAANTAEFREASAAAAPQAAATPWTHPGLGASVAQNLLNLGKVNLSQAFVADVQSNYIQQVEKLWTEYLRQGSMSLPKDKRFAAQEWLQEPAAAFTAAMYLLNTQSLNKLIEGLQGCEKTKARLRFAVQQWTEAACPANYLPFNPEAMQLALKTKGESLKAGIAQLMHDLAQGHLSQSDEAQFEVGKNLALTPGQVVFENEFFQLIEYKAQTAKVFERPLLLVPPCINKYYILDLRPGHSLVEYAVSQGHRVFMLSWVNPDERLAQKTWDDYTEHGVIKAIDVVGQISGQDKINTLGFCIGGTLLGTALSVLQSRAQQKAQSVTLLTSFLDFADTGVMDVFVDEAMVQMRELTIGEQSPNGGGLMIGRDLATTFSFLRPTDLVWNYVVGNYLKGKVPPAFDLLYWNADSTNLPGPMYCWYLRNTYLENNLIKPKKVKVCGEVVHLQQLAMPSFIYGSREDHIVPWQSAYASTQILQGEKTFVLGASGHIAGVINPPSQHKRSYWTNEQLGSNASEWLSQASEHPGSWWPQWSTWLAQQGGQLVKAPAQPGNRVYKAIEPAPGRYVKARA